MLTKEKFPRNPNKLWIHSKSGGWEFDPYQLEKSLKTSLFSFYPVAEVRYSLSVGDFIHYHL
jgi:hypothetical protein